MATRLPPIIRLPGLRLQHQKSKIQHQGNHPLLGKPKLVYHFLEDVEPVTRYSPNGYHPAEICDRLCS